MEVLCREIGATGRVPQGNTSGRAPILLQQQVMAFVWFISNSKVTRAVSDRFDVTMSSLDRIIRRDIVQSMHGYETKVHQMAQSYVAYYVTNYVNHVFKIFCLCNSIIELQIVKKH